MTAKFIPAAANLLVVDDEPRIRDSICALLRSRAFAVRSCDCGQAALDQLMLGGVDLMLLDLHLGDIGGLSLLEMIRRAGLDTAVIVVSGDAVIDSAISALRLGASDYLRKPYDPDELLYRVEMVLQRRRLEQDNALLARQLSLSERAHRFLVESSPDVIFTLDDKGQITFINERGAVLTGYAPRELIGRSLMSLVVPGDVDRVRYAIGRVGSQLTIEFRIACNDAWVAERHLEANLVPLDPPSPQGGNWPGPSSGLYGIARDITDKKAAEERLSHLAYHDLLTGLPNRVLFRDRLGLATLQAKRCGSKVAAMFVDLDRFKLANDTFGHLKGDELLQQAAERLRNVLRETDTVARVGGDEFTVLLPALLSRDDAAVVASKLVESLAVPFMIDGCELFLTASVGIAIYPDDGDNIEALLQHADIAMYSIKAQGKNGFGFFRMDMGDKSAQCLSLENEVRRAMELGQFELYYQPQVNFRTRRVVGCEALIRWNHPTKGLVAAGGFLSVVEEIRLMTPLTYWVIEQACRTLRSWWQDGVEISRMSVNVPPSVLAEDDFSERLLAIVDGHGIERECFEIELTENSFIADQQAIALKLAALTDAGIRVAIDDFGTQYSSLSYLRHLPVTTLKIDQSFVREIEPGREDSPIVRAIVAIASGLGLHLIAEGVETELQLECLGSLGAHDIQGFLFGKPMSASQFFNFVRQQDIQYAWEV